MKKVILVFVLLLQEFALGGIEQVRAFSQGLYGGGIYMVGYFPPLDDHPINLGELKRAKKLWLHALHTGSIAEKPEDAPQGTFNRWQREVEMIRQANNIKSVLIEQAMIHDIAFLLGMLPKQIKRLFLRGQVRVEGPQIYDFSEFLNLESVAIAQPEIEQIVLLPTVKRLRLRTDSVVQSLTASERLEIVDFGGRPLDKNAVKQFIPIDDSSYCPGEALP
jgi:hypothetical protein